MRKTTTTNPPTQRTRNRRDRGSNDVLMARLQEHLDFLRLTHTKRQLEELLAWALHEQPSPTELLEHVLGQEVATKRDARIERRITTSGLRERKLLEAFDFDFQPTLDRGTVIELGRLDFVERAEDVVINGDPGTGKSHILKAIGLRACERAVPFRYARCVDLVDDLHAGLADGTYPKRLRAWARPKLLVIDDVGLGQLKKHDDEPSAAHSLYNLIDRRHSRVSTAITSNIELSEWGRYLGDAIITRAILDRIVMNAIHLRIEGPSYRQRVAEDRAKERAVRRRRERSKSPASGAKSKSTSHSRSKSRSRSSP